MTSNKKYGLILSDKSKNKPPLFQATRNVFGNDSDSEDESSKRPVLLRPSDNTNRQSKITQEKAVIEDPTVYQYDEIYDSMTSKKEEKKELDKEGKKPKYIENLMKAANKRKIEYERRLERQIQKEREKEGDEFADKEVFVTSAYKKKLEEMKIEEEKEKYEEYLESIGDVTKQRDLGGFYRHLYDQKLGPDKAANVNEKQLESSEVKDNIDSDKKIIDVEKSETRKRNYRKRKSSGDNSTPLSDGEIEDSDEEINRCNLEDIRLSKKAKLIDENIDADSDFSIDSDEEKNSDESKRENNVKLINQENSTNRSSTTLGDNEDKKAKFDKQLPEDKTNSEKKEKIDIWKKRTVGDVFEQALKRYYERKSTRGF
ncbi:nuclear speckle splicing regulatory protein 1-like [Battus philenor]|uniref:nuclear speckle splicing regulatory protein 1-like n=1 Tax=Battus philenor TaxID=42288 RepID=UPI0035D0047D